MSPSKDALGSCGRGSEQVSLERGSRVEPRVRMCTAALGKGRTATLRDPPLLDPKSPTFRSWALPFPFQAARSGTGLVGARRRHQAAALRPLQCEVRRCKRGGRSPGGGAWASWSAAVC